jgi:hypothetical protein
MFKNIISLRASQKGKEDKKKLELHLLIRYQLKLGSILTSRRRDQMSVWAFADQQNMPAG